MHLPHPAIVLLSCHSRFRRLSEREILLARVLEARLDARRARRRALLGRLSRRAA